jgi:hypothetical protein
MFFWSASLPAGPPQAAREQTIKHASTNIEIRLHRLPRLLRLLELSVNTCEFPPL